MKTVIKLVSTVLLVSGLSIQTQAVDFIDDSEVTGIEALIADMDAPVALHKKGKHRRRGCKKAKLSDEQKKLMKATRGEFRKQVMPLRKAMKKARKAYRQTINDESSTIENAITDSSAIKDLRIQLMDSRMQLRNEIFYTILNFEQRKPMQKCLLKKRIKRSKNRIKKMKKRLKKGRRDHGDHKPKK